MYRVAAISCYTSRNISNILLRYLLQVTWMEIWVIKQWHRWGSTLFRQLEQFPPHVIIWSGLKSGWLYGTYFFDGPVNQHSLLIWTRCKIVSSRNWKTLVLRKIPGLNRTRNRHITQSFLGNTLVGLSGNISLAVGHQCSSLHFTGHIEVPDLSPCENSLWGFLKEAVAQQRYQNPENLKQAEILSFKRVIPKWPRKCSAEHGAELFWHDNEVQTNTRDY